MRPWLCLLGFALVAIGGCSASNSVRPAALSANGGTILSLRTVDLPAQRGLLQTVLLIEDSGGDDRGVSPVEFIVGLDDGATLSIVQTNDTGLRVGDRVAIVRGAQTHLARPD